MSQSIIIRRHQDRVCEVCRAMWTSRERHTSDTAALAAAMDVKTPMEIQHEVTEKGGSFLSVEHKKACATSCHLEAPAKTAIENVLHEAPDAGCVGGDCGEARDATDGTASNGRNVSARCADRCTKLLRAPRRPPGSKQSCSAMTLETTHRRIYERTTKPRRSRRTQGPNQRIRGVSH